MRLGAAVFVIVSFAAILPGVAQWQWHLPAGVAPPPVPADNPLSAAKVELGRRLFYDADLSLDGTTSCATCHEQHRAFTEGNRSHPGVGGVPGRRNVMGLANVARFDPLTWADSTQHRLEGQVLVPLMGDHPVEMGMAGKGPELAKRLAGDNCYPRMFAAAFPEDGGRIDLGNITKALAAFERILVSYDAPYDRFARGDGAALSSSAQRGAALFSGGAHCVTCHTGPEFTDLKYHAIAPADPAASDRGLIEITRLAADEGAIRTPSLRNVALTGPYLHDGSAASLVDAIRRHAGVTLGDGDLADMVAFLESLSDTGFTTDPDFALPKTACGKPL